MTNYVHTDREGDTLRVMASPGYPGAALVRVRTGNGSAGTYVSADKVEEVCAALREAAGLPAVWTVAKRGDDGLVAPSGLVRWPGTGPDGAIPAAARSLAARILAAADEAEARAKRPKLPTAEDSVIKVDGRVWVRGGSYWGGAGLISGFTDGEMARQDFTVLYVPEASG